MAAPIADPAADLASAALDALKSGSGYDAALTHLAAMLSGRTGVSAAALRTAWKQASRIDMTAMLSALSQLGVAYSHNTETPGVAFDCSGLASWAWSRAGVRLPHQSQLMINQITPVALADVQPGDIFFYPGHVMISLGVGDAIVEAANTRLGVRVTALNGRHATDLLAGDPTLAG
jgi:cell wall-associated NlpC family hydrolase